MVKAPVHLVCGYLPSPVGKLKLVAGDRGLVAVLWEHDRPRRVPLADLAEDPGHPVLRQASTELQEFFEQKRTVFTVPLDIRGTDFQARVWQALLSIHYGETRTYRSIANQLGAPNATRAVGAANGRNPLSIVVPCHRVVGSNGKLTGFAGGLEAKSYLLNLEAQNSRLFR